MTKLRRMEVEDKGLAKASGIRSLSSSVQSTPEKNGHSDDASRSPDHPQEFVKNGPRKELLQSCSELEKKQSASSKCKIAEQVKTSSKPSKKQEPKKVASDLLNNGYPKKQPRKGENPMRFPQPGEPLDFAQLSSWICKNAACRARMSSDDAFCKRCSCCICHLFDDNKDPSLWLECTSEFGVGYSCGLSCHIECALQRKKVGVVNLGQLMQLDGNYCCAWCGKVSGILGSWRKQLIAARDARRIDVLCSRVLLSYRLLDGTARYKDLLEIVKEAKDKLETEVGQLNEISASMHRGIVSRLCIANDIQNLCSLAIEKADDLLSISAKHEKDKGYRSGESLPAACRFLFQDVTCSSVVIVLVEVSNSSSDNIKGYKLWYFKSRDEKPTNNPITVLPRNQKTILITDLHPCTEYIFEVVPYTEYGDLDHSMANCCTKSAEIIQKKPISPIIPHGQKQSSDAHENLNNKDSQPATVSRSSEFKVRGLGNVLELARVQEKGSLEGLTAVDVGKTSEVRKQLKPKSKEQFPFVPRGCLDLNLVSVPDLNEELIPPFDYSKDEDNDCTVSHDNENRISGDSRTCVNGPAVESQPEPPLKRLASTNEEAHDSDSALIDNSLSGVSNGYAGLDENFEYCVKMIRWLECQGHIKKEFRLKLLTWYSMRSTEQERRVVSTFVQTLIDDPCSLAAQLVDSFSDFISSKRQRNGSYIS